MRRLPRKLLMWGGAASIAGAGFAFMASNTVFTSSAGEGAGAVTGYTASNQTYQFTNTPATGIATLESVTFKLTSMATTSNANVQPVNVQVYPEKATGARPWGKSLNCTISTAGWTITGAGHGHGIYSCTFSPKVVPIATFQKLDVEANQ